MPIPPRGPRNILHKGSFSDNFLGLVSRALAAHAEATSRSRLAERLIDLAGKPDGWAHVQCGPLDRGNARFLGETLLLCCRKKTPFRAREALQDFADQLERGKGRASLQGQFSDYAKELAESVRAFARLLPQGRVGNHRQAPKSKSTFIVKEVFNSHSGRIPPKGSAAAKARRAAIRNSVGENLPTGDTEGRDIEYLVRTGDVASKRKDRATRRFIREWAKLNPR